PGDREFDRDRALVARPVGPGRRVQARHIELWSTNGGGVSRDHVASLLRALLEGERAGAGGEGARVRDRRQSLADLRRVAAQRNRVPIPLRGRAGNALVCRTEKGGSERIRSIRERSRPPGAFGAG